MRNYKREWIFLDLLDIPDDFQAAFGGSSVFNQTLFRRGIKSIDSARGFLEPARYLSALPSQLPGLTKSVERIKEAFQEGQTILVWGDFDVDGQTSTTLLVSALSGHGSKIHHYIPNRARESHGISIDTLKQKIKDLQPSILLTCDTGIDAVEPITFAQSSGIDVIITDHHQLPQDLPPAYSIVNPNMLPEDHPLFSLPGVGVAYKLIESLYTDLGLDPDMYLDLVALGIVSDVAQQTKDTRYLLQKGLALLKNTPRLGIQKLLEKARAKPQDITEETIGFLIGPRLNALGRLDDANSCVEFFTTTDNARAAELAKHLENLNSRRQTLTEEIYKDSINEINKNPHLVQEFPVLVLESTSQWHPGVIGIVASRLVERFHKPVIMLSQEGKITRGSARSVPGVPISALIAESAALLISHGGHPMAAGVSLLHENVKQFRRDLSDNFTRVVGGHSEPPKVIIDAELPFKSISAAYINDFQRLAPFGAGNPKLLFATRGVHLEPGSTNSIGRDKNHKKLTLTDSSGFRQEFLWWNSADIDLPEGDLDVAYSLDLRTYNQNIQVQATLQHFRNSPGTPVLIEESPELDLIDLRSCPDPHQEISSYLDLADTQIWAESNYPEGIATLARSELTRSDTLVIWTTPPSREIFKRALDQAQPKKLVFFAQDPDTQTLRKFITNLHGLLKFVIDSDIKDFDFLKAAQRIAVTPALIEVGLAWIHAHGDYDLSRFSNGNQISPGPKENLPGFEAIDQKLKFLLRETAAYRSHFNKANLDTLL